MAEGYYEMSLEQSLLLPPDEFEHAAHVMLYTKCPGRLFEKYPLKYAVMMQVRFDGALGFPGGIVDKGETPEAAASRELEEEVGGERLLIQRVDHIMTQVSKKTRFCLHFYGKQLADMNTFISMERQVLHAKDWGSEVMGIVRCPLYTLPNGMGLPCFLGNRFIGTGKEQLLVSLVKCGLFTAAEVKEAVEISQQVNTFVTKTNTNY